MSLSLPALRPKRNSPAALALAALVFAATPALSQDGGSVLESPRLRALAEKVRAGSSRALAEFWDAVQREGAPLVEPGAGDSTLLLVTFVYHGDSATRNVVLFRGPRVS